MKKKYKIFFISLVLIVFVLAVLTSRKGKIEVVEASDIQENLIYKVDIKGEVINPGVYEVNNSDRIIDVINKAGGLCENADTSKTNLSKRIKDEMVIIIYSNEEEKNAKYETQLSSDIVTNDNSLISINDAPIDVLKTLPGIGESKARSIIEYREQNRFEVKEDIKNVTGIGESLFEKIKDYITV